MKNIEPKFRCGTTAAIQELVRELELPYSPYMQDWSYEVANLRDTEIYLDYYDNS